MKRKVFYICEKCENTSEDFDTIQICEAGHLGLTLGEYRHYEDLKESVRYCSYMVSATNNENTRNRQDWAIEKLIEFEKEHNIISQQN